MLMHDMAPCRKEDEGVVDSSWQRTHDVLRFNSQGHIYGRGQANHYPQGHLGIRSNKNPSEMWWRPHALRIFSDFRGFWATDRSGQEQWSEMRRRSRSCGGLNVIMPLVHVYVYWVANLVSLLLTGLGFLEPQLRHWWRVTVISRAGCEWLRIFFNVPASEAVSHYDTKVQCDWRLLMLRHVFIVNDLRMYIRVSHIRIITN